MKIVKLLAVSITLAVSSGAFAQGLTREEVRADLVRVEQNGSRLVTDASYPDVGTIYQNQVARTKTLDTAGYGGAMNSSTSGGTRGSSSMCVGPYSFCNPYAGS